MVAQVHWQMHVEGPFVHTMKLSLEIDAVSVTA